MEITTKKISDLTPCPYNPRTISDEALAGLTASINEYGYIDPIIWNKRTRNVVGGNMRMRVLKQQGIKEADVVVVDLSLDKEKALNVALNSKYIAGDWSPRLGALLKEIETETPDLYADLNLSALLEDIPVIVPEIPEGLTDPDEVPEPAEEPIIKTGDLITMGTHKILCADATKMDDVNRLVSNEKLDIIFTDLPYNVDYEGYTKDKLKIKNDSMSDEEFSKFLESAFINYRLITKEGAGLYICHPSSYQREFQNALEKAGFEIRCQIIWAKNTFAWGFGRYKFQHEPIFYAHVKGQSDSWYGDKSQSTLWQENKPSANRLHPTSKPVELIERALRNSSKTGDIVGDLFGGSGSTLIASERTGRHCRMMELDPKYTQVIIERWINYTGRQVDVIVERDGKAIQWKKVQGEQ
jgi:DNA modification methylase